MVSVVSKKVSGNPPHPSYDIQSSDGKGNVAGAALSVPDAVRAAANNANRVATRQMGPGIWLLGGPYNSMAVEFKDYPVLIEAPMDQERTEPVITATKRPVPCKPNRYDNNTQHQFH